MGALEGQSQRSGSGSGSWSSHREKMEEATPLASKTEESPQAKECGQPEKARTQSPPQKECSPAGI